MPNVADNFDIEALSQESDQDTDLVKNLRAALKAAAAKNKEQETELGQLKSQARGVSLAELFKSKGVPEAAAKLYPEGADASEEAVSKWLEEFGPLFGVKSEPKADAQTQDAASQFSNAVSTAPPSEGFDAESIEAAMKGAKTPEEFQELLRKL